MKKFLIVTSLSDNSTANYIIEAAIRENLSIFVYSDLPHSYADATGPGLVDVHLLLKRIGFLPDMLLFIEGGTMEVFPIGLDRIDCLTAWYGIDTHMDFNRHLNISHLFDVTFTAQYQYIEPLKQAGITQVFWLPLAFDESLVQAHKEGQRDIDISYIGSMKKQVNPKRHDFLDLLSKHFPNNYFGTATRQEMYNIYRRSKVVFNYSVNNDINMRFFEAIGNGAVLVSNPIIGNGIDELFTRQRDFIEYEDNASLVEKIKQLLTDEQYRSNIGDSACLKVLKEHTYDNRLKLLLEKVQSCKKSSEISLGKYYTALLSIKHPTGILWLFEKSLNHLKIHPLKRLVFGLLQQILFLLRLIIDLVYRIKNIHSASAKK